MKVGVVVFPGSNCDRDMYHVLSDVFHFDTQYFLAIPFHARNIVCQDEKHQIKHDTYHDRNYYQEKPQPQLSQLF